MFILIKAQCKGLGAWLIISIIIHVYDTIKACGILFTREHQFKHVLWPNGCAYQSDFTFSIVFQACGRNLPFAGMVCLLLEGPSHVSIRYCACMWMNTSFHNRSNIGIIPELNFYQIS